MATTRVVIIGAVALGPKTACRIKRLRPDFHVTMVDQDEYISYGGCGIPYYISGDVSDVSELMSTSFHMLRNPQFFEKAKGVKVLTRTRAESIDRKAKTVRIRDLNTGQEDDLPYDYLVLATGSVANRPPIPGLDHPRVTSVSNLHEAVAVKEKIAQGEVDKAVIVGAGAIGCEMAEALSDLWGVETALVEIAPQVLPGVLDTSLARMVRKHLEEHDVAVHLGETVREVAAPAEGDGPLVVRTDHRELEADLVITAVGVRPSGELARNAGLAVSPRGGILVNQRLQTSDPFIYAGGDCIEVMHQITGRHFHFPQGSLANRQGRVIGTNICGGSARFPGSVGTFAVKIFDLAVATAGLTRKAAREEGFDPLFVLLVQADRAHFYPTQDLMYLAAVVDRRTRRVLGIQGVSHNGDALVGRVNAVAAIMAARGTVEDLSNLEVAYSPPFASAMDIVNALGNTAENTLDGLNRPLDPEVFEDLFFHGQDDRILCLDVRGPQNAAPFVARFGDRWINIPQETLEERLDQVPRDKQLVLICNSGVRSYEALLQLRKAGITNALNLQGGVAAIKKSGIVDLSGE
ncbi:NADPH-dependent 2,4-dienoyl-CoA reductase, sulfur reductase [Desulfacinum hydrothermale DSM 13146]|uniref:NADPH-dependent 2,4-dienoyl-CoA reductase, sulfur reductase n=1 Tax=Desulfacinum hydrothermale DSM 13146 TaxID=1121390 RepID=A0A1W1XT96_9BACT|nr:FAD-dependent oxidoreductase [Desulfacinum hydrothermale]SMC26771.1 NADPH-dependent 2,4-dienoyl-CoA reductase, sulfur reductase [Desulfacinum hydrothermale DSM 13146]